MISTDYRVILREQLNQRCKTNPRYSLRAFARDLDISCARLSLVLNGKKGLSVIAAKEIAFKLGFSDRDSSVFCDLVQSQHARSQAAKEIALTRLQSKQADIQGRALQADTFKVISDWYHFAILQLMQIPSFQSDTIWIAKVLEITVSQAEEALDRLLRMELIKKENGKFRVLQTYVSTPDGVPSDAIRKFHQQILQKALQAVDMQTTEERDNTSLIMPVNAGDLSKVRERIRKFREDLCREFTTDDDRLNSVYSLSIQFFRIGHVQ